MLLSCKFEKLSTDKTKDIEFTVVPENEIPQEVMNIIEEKKNSEFKVAYSDPEYTYIIIGYGKQDYQGYTINIENLYETENAVYVQTNFKGPEEYSNIQSETYPYIVIKIESTNKNIIFGE